MLAGAAIALAACGSSTPSSSSKPTGAVVKTASSPYGTILVNAGGMTLYAFSSDTATVSHCTGSCAQLWPALTTKGKPQAQGQADSSLLSTLSRSGNVTQVSYSGHPLYTYSGDQQPGQYHGQGFAGLWHVVSASGRVVTSSSPTTTTAPATTTTAPATTTTAPATTTTSHPTTTTSSSSTTTSSTTTTTSASMAPY